VRALGVACVVCCALGSAAAARTAHATEAPWRADVISPLGLELLTGDETPSLILAQRAIDREWTSPGDSDYVKIPGGKSELGAMTMSAAFPGTGQLYAGESRGFYFAALEVLGWAGVLFFHHDANGLREDARALAGEPADSTSKWSFQRYENATNQDASYLKSLYAADPEAFDQAIDNDPRYAPGWSTSQDHSQFSDLRDQSDRRLTQAHVSEGTLWVNHVVAAFDAWRAARLHNMPLGGGIGLKADGHWRAGHPAFTVALQRSF